MINNSIWKFQLCR